MSWQDYIVLGIGLVIIVLLVRSFVALFRRRGNRGCASCDEANCPFRNNRGKGNCDAA